MNWDAVAAVAELLGALAVIASLAYLALQIRQNTRSMRSATYDSLVGRFVDWIQPIAGDPNLAASFEAVVEDWDGATPEQRSRMVYMMFGAFKLFENFYYQARQGTLDEAQWAGWRNLIFLYFSRPGVQAWWELRRDAFSSDFQQFLAAGSATGTLPSPAEMVRRREGTLEKEI